MSTSHVAIHPMPADAPAVRLIGPGAVREALAKGYADFMAMPSHLAFIALIYPILGVFLASIAFGYDLLPLLFPLVSGFALVGPLAGIGLYELSRRREAGLEPHWKDAFEVLRSPAIGSIVAMGVVLVVTFLVWLLVAHAIFRAVIGPTDGMSYDQLLRLILTTPKGWTMIIVGDVVGFLFAAFVLSISVVAFPLILDREAGVGTAIVTSVRAVRANPGTMALWGLVVATLVALGSIPLFIGLAIVMPILGHATWHLYRAVVAA